MTTIRSVHRLLGDKIADIADAKNQNQTMRSRYKTDLDRAKDMDAFNRSKMIAEVVSRMGQTHEEADAYLETLGGQLSGAARAVLLEGIRAVRADIRKDLEAWEQVCPREDREAQFKAAEVRYKNRKYEAQEIEHSYQSFRENVGATDFSYAFVFKQLLDSSAFDDFDAYWSRGWFQRWKGRFNKQTKKMDECHGQYLVRLNRFKDDIAPLIDGTPHNPVNLVKAKKALEEEHAKAFSLMSAAGGQLKKISQTLKYEKDLEKKVSDEGLMARYVEWVEREMNQSEAFYLALGDHYRPMITVSRLHPEETWSTEKAKGLIAKINAYQAMIERQSEVIDGLEKTQKNLERTRSKMHSKLSRVGSKKAKGLAIDQISAALDEASRKGRASARWFESSRDRFKQGNAGLVGDEVLFWTAVYFLMGSGSSSATTVDPEMKAAMDQVGQDMAIQAPDLSEVDSMTDSFVGLEEASVSRSLETGLSSQLSAIDSTVNDAFESSHSYSGIGSGSSFGGGSSGSFGSSFSSDSGSSFGGCDSGGCGGF